MYERRCLRFADSGVFIFKINAILATSFFDKILFYLCLFAILGQFTRNYTQTTKRGLLTTNKG